MDFPPVPLWLVNWGQYVNVASTHVSTLEHEVGDDSVETGSGVSEALLTSAESSEVGGSLGDNVVVELEGDSASWGV